MYKLVPVAKPVRSPVVCEQSIKAFTVLKLRNYFVKSFLQNIKMERLQAEIQFLDREERVLQMELMDVLSEVTTPDNSDVEGEDIEEPAMPDVRRALLEVGALPTRWTAYSELYQNAEYRMKAQKKVRKLKNMIKKCTLNEVMMNLQYITALQNVERNYPDDGGRAGLNSLVACDHVLNPEV